MNLGLFEKLTQHRTKIAKALDDPSVIGLASSAEEKYSDQAHFIYELIQNADDVGATCATFRLYDDRLLFIHNGKKHFTISDVENEKIDGESGRLGHINAITSYANSSKTSGNTIGRFGLGFKAVFQYTTEPNIYDPEIAFKITRKIVPVLITDDCKFRKPDETAFELIFDHPYRSKEIAYKDISHKLSNLVDPMLFLRNLKRIEYYIGSSYGEYSKEVLDKETLADGTSASLFGMQSASGREKVWLFSRKNEYNGKEHMYAVGFFLDEKGEIKPISKYAFCFFPTKKTTNLPFLIHAPFLLTDSREGIKAGEAHNIKMIEWLAELAADSYVYLRDIGIKRGHPLIHDNLLSWVPFNPSKYHSDNAEDDISFIPFYYCVLNKLKTERLIPSYGECCYSKDVCIASSLVISELFSNQQLSQLCNRPEARWAFPSVNWDAIRRLHDGQSEYLRQIVCTVFDTIDDVLRLITADFIEKQDIKWLSKYYDFLTKDGNRVLKYKTFPIFLDEKGKAVAAYEKDKPILFLKDDDNSGYVTVNEDLYAQESAQRILNMMNIHKPELKDKIYNKILKKKELNSKSDLRNLLNYYIYLKEEDKETEDFIEEIKERKFVSSCTEDYSEESVSEPGLLYYPSDDLLYYFKNTRALFVDLREYNSYLKPRELKYFRDFLVDCGVDEHVAVVEDECDEETIIEELGDDWPRSTDYREWVDSHPHYDSEVIDRIISNEDKTLSRILWEQLSQIIGNEFDEFDDYYGDAYVGKYRYYFRKDQEMNFDSLALGKVCESKWLLDVNGVFCAPCELTVQTLNSQYNRNFDGFVALIRLLDITDEHPELNNLDKDTRQKIEKYDRFVKLGLDRYSDDELAEIIEALKQKKNKNTDAEEPEDINARQASEDKIIGEITRAVKKHTVSAPRKENADESQLQDAGVNQPASIDVEKKINDAKLKCEEEISKLVQQEEARRRVDENEKYSYGWFSGLLELEAIADGEDNSNSREVSISFSKIEKDSTATRTVLLSNPSTDIPQVMELLVDIPMELSLRNGESKRLIIDAINIRSYTIRVKVKEDEWLDTADLDLVSEVKIVSQNPSFLHRELQKQFVNTAGAIPDISDKYDMQANLCSNIDFIFGPPGTGKTTYLAGTVIPELLKSKEKAKILVLTPTNKAADVLVDKVMVLNGEDRSYESWLLRFGVTLNNEIESSPIFKGKEADLKNYQNLVVVTTMARLPYDFFIAKDRSQTMLNEIKWDYIIVDEASMIPLIQMVYMLYAMHVDKFIVAGDPFQIEPTVSISDWKEENIYTMVHLDNFSTKVNTVPHKFDIKLLTTQYRSVPKIGELYSKLTYNGVLKHARKDSDSRPLNIDNFLDCETLNVIRFPVSAYEGIYRAKRLKMSNYQIYSSLLTFEFARYLSLALSRCNIGKEFSIGIITPYGAQAGIIDNLIASSDIPKRIKLNTGTIHSFQGDECDIVIAVFNPPPKITRNDQMFLNRKNIINVAISRARDYLFIVEPDEDTKGAENLWLINKLNSLIEKGVYREYFGAELEEMMFNDEKYLEHQTFTTGHQSVNVYGDKNTNLNYEVRSEDNAVDVQLHGISKFAPIIQDDKNKQSYTEAEIRALLNGQKVFHKSFGVGTVITVETNLIHVKFDDGVHKMMYPMSIEKFLIIQNERVRGIVNAWYKINT